MSRSSRRPNKATVIKHHQAMKSPNRSKIGYIGRVDLMIMGEPKESKARIKADVEAWLKAHPITTYTKDGKPRKEWRKPGLSTRKGHH